MPTFTLEDAIEIAVRAHKGQKDWSGWPYVTHPLRLMTRMETEELKILAVLHDVVEDTDVTLEQLAEFGMTLDLVTALRLLTRTDEFKTPAGYHAYVVRLSTNQLARKVKIADLEDNMDIKRMPRPTEKKDVARLASYYEHWKLLKEIDGA